VTPDAACSAPGLMFRQAQHEVTDRNLTLSLSKGERRLSPSPQGERVGVGGTPLIPQGRGDLGARMARVFRARTIGPVIIIGTDCPAMRKSDIAAAFRALGQADAVFGPAEDGGYWLIGLKRLRGVPHLFDGVRWSSEHALADTRASLPKTWRVAMLRTLSDVDTAAEWAREKGALSFPSASA
jgi:glycosyltransferase A (GT-A) superfamily protein (DUF2064 family)